MSDPIENSTFQIGAEIIPEPPTVFLSYSHDSDAHKEWVLTLATQLRAAGINILLDQWELGPGDDVPKFMERSVSSSLRVIMVCTEEYVRKADDGKGGVGYEAMVVTGELVSDLGTRKFIPITRQTADPKIIPKCMSGRFYVDFSCNSELEKSIEELARDIHKAPLVQKPPIGINPYTSEAPSPAPLAHTDEGAIDSPAAVYSTALALAKSEDFQQWTAFVHKHKKQAQENLSTWRAQNQASTPRTKDALPEFFLPAVELYNNVFAIVIAAIDSGNDKFRNQLSLIDWIREPKGWERNGQTLWVELPDLILFTFQACIGAFTLNRQQPDLTYSLATTPLADRYSQRETQPLFNYSKIVGWPESLGHHCSITDTFIKNYFDKQEWLHEIFGDQDTAIGSYGAYYSFLNIIDFLSASKNGLIQDTKGKEPFNIHIPRAPLFSANLSAEHQQIAGAILKNNCDFLNSVIKENKIDREGIPEEWKAWMILCYSWLHQVYKNRFDFNIPHKKFPEFLTQSEGRLDTL